MGRSALARPLRNACRTVVGAVLVAAAAPTIHFGTGTAGLLEAMAEAGGRGCDWPRLARPAGRGGNRLPGRAIQGNLDPAALLAPWSVVEQEAADVLARAGGRPGHVFNLGHGVLPETDPGMLTRLAALVGNGRRSPSPHDAGSRPDGVRLTRSPRRRARVLRRHPRRAPDRA